MRKLFLAIMAVAAIALVGCKDKNEPEVNIDCSLPDNVEAVDLGLPSGIKWANMNAGKAEALGTMGTECTDCPAVEISDDNTTIKLYNPKKVEFMKNKSEE